MRSVLYIYNGPSRRAMLDRTSPSELPRSFFGGYLELRERADLTVSIVDRDQALSSVWQRMARKIPLLGAALVCFQYRLHEYDAIVSSANLDIVLLHFLMHPKSRTRWILTNVNFTTLLRRGSWLRRRFHIASLKKADTIVCLSRAQEKVLIEAGIREERLRFIPLGVDEQLLELPSEEGTYLLAAGRDSARDYRTLLEAVGESHLLVLVTSPRNMQGLTVPSTTTVLYDIDHTDLLTHYSEAQMVVVPSTAEESGEGSDCSGQTVVLEAMALGKPVIATQRAWMDDYVVPGEDVVVVPPGDPRALRAAIDEYRANRERRRALGDRARATVRTKFTYQLFAQRLTTVILQRLS